MIVTKMGKIIRKNAEQNYNFFGNGSDGSPSNRGPWQLHFFFGNGNLQLIRTCGGTVISCDQGCWQNLTFTTSFQFLTIDRYFVWKGYRGGWSIAILRVVFTDRTAFPAQRLPRTTINHSCTAIPVDWHSFLCKKAADDLRMWNRNFM